MKKFFLMFLLSSSLLSADVNSLCKTECGLFLEDEEVNLYSKNIITNTNKDLKIMCKDKIPGSVELVPKISLRTTLGKHNVVIFNNDSHACDSGHRLKGMYEYHFDTVLKSLSDECRCYDKGYVKLFVRSYELNNTKKIDGSVVARAYCVKPIDFVVTKDDIKKYDCGDAANQSYMNGGDSWMTMADCLVDKIFFAQKIASEINHENFKNAKFSVANKICYIYNSKKVLAGVSSSLVGKKASTKAINEQ